MSTDIVERVRRSARYRQVDVGLLERIAAEELPKARNADDAVKRVKRRLHQTVSAFTRGRAGGPVTWPDDPAAIRGTCLELMRTHASTAERVDVLDRFYAGIWAVTGLPASILDLGCGLGPLALPWMRIGDAHVHAVDVDTGALGTVDSFLAAVGQPHRVEARDLVRGAPDASADVALLLKLVTTLDRQDPGAATSLVRALRARFAVVSFPARSLGGRADARGVAYRDRLDRLAADAGVRAVTEASVPGELVFVLRLPALDG